MEDCTQRSPTKKVNYHNEVNYIIIATEKVNYIQRSYTKTIYCAKGAVA